MLRLFGLVGVCSAALAVVGTQSRGATLAVVTAGLYYWLALSKRRMAGLVTIAALAALALTFAPQSYFSRITETDVQTDSSAQGRLRAWGAAFQMALDFPLGVGVGSFNSAYGRYYMPEEDDVFSSRRWISAHSIYFKVLGESGFLGFILLIAVLVTNFRDNGRCLRFARAHPESSAIEDRWPALLNFGLIGYSVAGAFLGGLSYPHLYFLSGLTVACRQMTVDRPVQAAAPAPAVVARPVSNVALLAPRAQAPRPPAPALPVRQPRFASRAPRS
jgi:probable O-glycosylation ligase (exosortase A-associated)